VYPVLVINFSLYILTMSSKNQDGEQASEEVTVVVNRTIKPGSEKNYDEWLRRFLTLGMNVPGYLGTTTIMEAGTDSTVRHIIHRFRDKASLDAWENSEELCKLMQK
jgi:antibiotic biosynthesis monooxygenase (ABM) superfamily enzyme